MASINNVTLNIQSGASADQMKVIVGFTLAFTAAEAGKSFQYGITLHGEDKTGDDEASFSSSGQLIYTFKFAGGLKVFDHKSITAQAGEQLITEVREVSIEKLNEDPGFDIINNGPEVFVKIAHPDEVYATVNLVVAEMRSTPFALKL